MTERMTDQKVAKGIGLGMAAGAVGLAGWGFFPALLLAVGVPAVWRSVDVLIEELSGHDKPEDSDKEAHE